MAIPFNPQTGQPLSASSPQGGAIPFNPSTGQPIGGAQVDTSQKPQTSSLSLADMIRNAGQVGIGEAKVATGLGNSADVLGTLNRLSKGDNSDLNKGKILGPLQSGDSLGAANTLAGNNPDWTKLGGLTAPVSTTPDFTGQTQTQRAAALTPSNTAQKVGSIGATAALSLAPMAAEIGPQVAKSLTPKVLTPEEIAIKDAQKVSIQKAATAAKVQKVAQSWESPTVPGKASNPASFNKARNVLAQNPNTTTFLAEQKLSPAQHIENGRYATADSATALRETAGKMSSDALRPSLREADFSTPKTPVSEVVKNAISEAKKDPNITPGNLETVIRNINKEAGALERKFPEGMSLENMHDNKITYAKSGGYKPIGTVADNNIATMNRNIASSLQRLVETKAPSSIPVAEFNKYLGQYYKAADYLDALDTKKAPMSTMQYVAHKGAQVVGATVGHGIGGGILGGVGGYMIGGALEHALENMALPLRDSFLKNLKVTQPEVYTKVKGFLGNEEAARATRLALPEGPTRLGSGADKSSVKGVPATKTLPTANPKTGRMQRTYTSTPQ